MPKLDPTQRHGQTTMAAWRVLAVVMFSATVAVAQTPMPENNEMTNATSCEVRSDGPNNDPVVSVLCQFPQDITLPRKLDFTLYQKPFHKIADPVLACDWTNDGTIIQCTPKASPCKLITHSTDITNSVTFQVPIDMARTTEFYCGMSEKGTNTRPELLCHLDPTLLLDLCISAGTTEYIKEVIYVPVIVVLLIIIVILICWQRRRVREICCKRGNDESDDKDQDGEDAKSSSGEDEALPNTVRAPLPHKARECFELDDMTVRKDSGGPRESNMNVHQPAPTSSQSTYSFLSKNTTPTPTPTPTPTRKVDKPRSKHVKNRTDASQMTIARVCLVVPLAAAMLTCVSAVENTTTAIQPEGTISCEVDMDNIKESAFVICHFPVNIRDHQWDFSLRYLHTTAQKSIIEELAAKCHWPSPVSYIGEPGFGLPADQNITDTARFSIPQSALCSLFFCQLSPQDNDFPSVPCQLPTKGNASCREPLDPSEEQDNFLTKGQQIGVTTLAILLFVCVVLALSCLLVVRCKCRLVPRNWPDPIEYAAYTDSWDSVICCRPFKSCVYKNGSWRDRYTETEVVDMRDYMLPINVWHPDAVQPLVSEYNLRPTATSSRQPVQAAVKQPPPKDPEGQKLGPDHAATRPSVQVAAHPKEDQPPTPQPSGASSEQSKCSICLGTIKVPKSLSCGHTFCTACIDPWLKTKNTCPDCNKIVGTLLGDQPEDGTMAMTYSKEPLLGYSGAGSFVIKYHFQAGRQQDNHPTPGKRYDATERLAYLPDTEEGRKVLMLLRIAFDRRLTFTIGQSLTSGSKVEGIIWNDIHHKTFRKGGQAQYGYPDKGYLARVQEDLTKKGVTEADLTKVQREFIRDPHSVCLTYDSDSNQDFSAVFSG